MDTFIRCLENHQCRLIISGKSNAFYRYFNDMSICSKNALERNPARIISNPQIPQTILEEQKLYLVWLWTKDEILFHIKDRDCDFYLVDAPFKFTGAVAMRKSYYMRETLTNFALTFQESGLEGALKRKYAQPSFCNARSPSSEIEEGFALRTVFYLYISAIFISVTAFVIECAFVLWRNRNC